MKQIALKNLTTWMIFTVLMLFSIALTSPPSYAADTVVVIPMGKSGPPAPVAKTGQTVTYATGDDGDLEKGVGMATGRFVDNNNGTVTDNLTGLIWLKEGQCVAFSAGDATGRNSRLWAAAVASANQLASGYCGLTDGSKAGDWRLPNVNELFSLIDRGQLNPALPTGSPLAASTAAGGYWSSTIYAGDSGSAWLVNCYDGYVFYISKSVDYYVRCVRGGQ